MPACYDEVIKNLDIDQRKSLFQLPREKLIGMAWLGYAGWMIVGKDYCGGVRFQGDFDDLPRVDAGLSQGPAKQFFKGYNPMLGINQNRDEYFVFASRQGETQVVSNCARRSKSASFPESCIKNGQGVRDCVVIALDVTIDSAGVTWERRFGPMYTRPVLISNGKAVTRVGESIESFVFGSHSHGYLCTHLCTQNH